MFKQISKSIIDNLFYTHLYIIIHVFLDELTVFLLLFICVCTRKSRNKASIFNFSEFSGREMNLVVVLITLIKQNLVKN